MTSEASAQQFDAVPPEPPPAPPRRGPSRAGWPRGAFRTAKWAVLAGWGALGAWHLVKPLPPGLRVESPWIDLPSGDVRPLIDLTTADAFGQPVLQQQIFDETLQVIAGARRFVVLDQFLFNDHQGAIPEPAAARPAIIDAGEPNLAPLRPLSRELAEALLVAKRARPALRILFITDPINDVYGGDPSPELARLEAAGIEVVRTELDALRDSNPAWSGLWRLTIDWWDGDAGGRGWLPNPLETGPSRVTFRAWARLLNFKANHRKVVIADDGSDPAGLVGIVGSANPHDASSAHTNLALELRGEVLRPLLESEFEIARFSGWSGPAWPGREAAPPGSAPDGRTGAQSASGRGAVTGADAAARRSAPGREPAVRAQVLTEGAIRDALLERFAATRAGEHIDVAMFYLSEHTLVEALLSASRRGVEVRLLLDPNKDAFGRAKGGIPNRPVASELVSRSDGAIKVRWYRTHGEQFHPKLVMVRGTSRTWLTLGSANLTRRNVGDFNLEANLAVESAADAPVARELATWFETVWSNRAPAGIEYSADFGTFADPAQSSYWAYRFMEATGLSTF